MICELRACDLLGDFLQLSCQMKSFVTFRETSRLLLWNPLKNVDPLTTAALPRDPPWEEVCSRLKGKRSSFHVGLQIV